MTTSNTNAHGDQFAVVDSANGANYKLNKGYINLSGFNNDLLIATEPHHILECISGLCDGSTRTTQSGDNFLFQNTTNQVYLTTTYATILGSQITYKPPSGTTHVEYEFNFQITFHDAHAVMHMKAYIDNNEVTIARKTCAVYIGVMVVQFKMNISIGTNNIPNAQVHTWTNSRVIKITGREYATAQEVLIYSNKYWDGVSTSTIAKPMVKVTAYGTKSTLSGLSLTNATNNRVLTSTGGTGLNCESNLTFDGTTLAVSGVPVNPSSGLIAIDIVNRSFSSSSSTFVYNFFAGDKTGHNGPLKLTEVGFYNIVLSYDWIQYSGSQYCRKAWRLCKITGQTNYGGVLSSNTGTSYFFKPNIPSSVGGITEQTTEQADYGGLSNATGYAWSAGYTKYGEHRGQGGTASSYGYVGEYSCFHCYISSSDLSSGECYIWPRYYTTYANSYPTKIRQLKLIATKLPDYSSGEFS